MTNTSKLDKAVWEEFTTNWANIGFETEAILAKRKRQKLEKSVPIRIDDLPKEGKEREAKVKVRVNQYFFRVVVLSSYDNKCCITGLSNSALLIAGHILPWAKNLNERMNPSNGLCMNLLHDKAFEIGLIGITSEYRIKLSPAISSVESDEAIEKFFLPFENKEILLPQKFLPDKKFLQQHFTTVFLS